MTTKKLSDRSCPACDSNTIPLDSATIESLLAQIGAHWQLNADGKSITRRYTFKGFARAVYLSNLCAWLAEEQGHHPDIAFGWGYCQVTLTTHTLDALSEIDFIWAAKLSELTDRS